MAPKLCAPMLLVAANNLTYSHLPQQDARCEGPFPKCRVLKSADSCIQDAAS
jgi:hypothetical protein